MNGYDLIERVIFERLDRALDTDVASVLTGDLVRDIRREFNANQLTIFQP